MLEVGCKAGQCGQVFRVTTDQHEYLCITNDGRRSDVKLSLSEPREAVFIAKVHAPQERPGTRENHKLSFGME